MIRAVLTIWLFSLCHVGLASAMQNLPVSLPAEMDADNALAQEMTALMHDYSQKLTQVRALDWFDIKTLQSRDWTPHLGKLKTECRQQQELCAQLLRSQLKALSEDPRLASTEPRTDYVGAVLSAMTDLCRVSLVNGYDSNLFNLCGGQTGIAGNAALVWYFLGNDALFDAYFNLFEGERRRTMAWLAEQPGESAKSQYQHLQSLDAYFLFATSFEIEDLLPAASSSWMLEFIKALASENYTFQLQAVLNMARLSYLLGDVEQGNNWKNVAELIIAEHPELKATSACYIDSERARINLAQAVVLRAPFDTAAVIPDLIKRDCPFSKLTIEYALASLRSSQPGEKTAETIAFAIGACTQCPRSRIAHLKVLLTIAQGKEAELLTLATYWLDESQVGQFTAVERQIVWVLADALANIQSRHLEAQQLYVALDKQVHNETINQTAITPDSLKNLARYDELIRVRVKETVRQGESLRIGLTESLRAQSLLHRLRIKRWQNEFAGVRDDAALAKLRKQKAELVAARDAISKLTGDSSLKRALRNHFSTMAAEAEVLFQEAYFQELASRKAEAAGASKREAWLGISNNDLSWHDEKKKVVGQSFPSLGAEEAYLSWLRVPGGYVATMAVPDPQHVSQWWDSHRMVSHFVPVSDAMASTLDVYRKLLQAGAIGSQDSKFVTDTQTSTSGLRLDLVPVWHLPDGSFIASEKPVAGAVRAQSFTELGDAIFTLLLAPFHAELARVQRLVISPDGALAYLPFETLSIKGVSILDTLDIAYVQSLAVHEELTNRVRAKKVSGPALLSFANPDYTTVAKKTSTAHVIPRFLAEAKWPALAGTQIESDALLQLFPGGLQRMGAKASRKQLDSLQRSGKLGKYRVLHFATHGYVDDERSALVLSMGDGADQGYLQDTDVLDLHLNTDLVLLSACNTGIGRNVSGEGVMGLPYAFMLAGNSNTLMSLWSVEDTGTAAFMATFMEKVHSGMDMFTALNQTKREFARGVHGKAFSDPLIWAAFVQYGIGSTLRQ